MSRLVRTPASPGRQAPPTPPVRVFTELTVDELKELIREVVREELARVLGNDSSEPKE